MARQETYFICFFPDVWHICNDMTAIGVSSCNLIDSLIKLGCLGIKLNIKFVNFPSTCFKLAVYRLESVYASDTET